MTRAELDQQMRAVLAQLELCSHVRAKALRPVPTDGGEADGSSDEGHLFFARMYGPPFWPTGGPASDEQRGATIRWAHAELAHLRGMEDRPRPEGETRAQRDRRIVRDGEDFEAREVAVRFRCGEQDVRRARRRAGREPDRGRPVRSEEPPDRTTRRTRASELRSDGMSMTAIALLLGVDKATVSRDLQGLAA